MSFVSQFYRQVRTYVYHPVYKGPFEYKKKDTFMTKFPFGVNKTKLENEATEINQIRESPLLEQDISPFHLVWRHKSLFNNVWNEKVVLRRLGMHQRTNNVPVVIPNTPHYNAMLWEVKHLIKLKPLRFPNGVPSEEDLGNIKLELGTGEMMIDSKFKIDQEQLDKATTPPMFTGRYLREYLKWCSGVIGSSLPNHEVRRIDGNRIEEHDRNMKNYHKHQHPFYESKN